MSSQCSREVWTRVQMLASSVGILSAKRSHRDGTQQPSVLPKMAGPDSSILNLKSLGMASFRLETLEFHHGCD